MYNNLKELTSANFLRKKDELTEILKTLEVDIFKEKEMKEEYKSLIGKSVDLYDKLEAIVIKIIKLNFINLER